MQVHVILLFQEFPVLVSRSQSSRLLTLTVVRHHSVQYCSGRKAPIAVIPKLQTNSLANALRSRSNDGQCGFHVGRVVRCDSWCRWNAADSFLDSAECASQTGTPIATGARNLALSSKAKSIPFAGAELNLALCPAIRGRSQELETKDDARANLPLLGIYRIGNCKTCVKSVTEPFLAGL